MSIDSRVMQVAIVVRDLDEKVRWWSAFLGVEPYKFVTTGPLEETGVEYRGEQTPARLKVAVFKLGECEIELMEPIGAPSVWQDHLDQYGEGLHHLGFVADDMPQGIAHLASLGIPVVQEAGYVNEHEDGRYAYFGSEEQLGAMVELNVLK